MYGTSDSNVVQLAISKADWALIRNALDAYAHNSTYQELHNRLDKQVIWTKQQGATTRHG